MNDLLIHEITKSQLASFAASPSHAVLILGSSGSGKKTLSKHIAGQVLQLPAEAISGYAYARIISPVEGKAIGIEAIRELEHFLSLVVPSRASYSRVVIIEDAHLLTTEAQNALLKTLEEPPQGTLLILTASHEQALLPTIRSRTQSITIKRPLTDDIKQYFKAQGFADKDVQQAMAISGGLSGLLASLLNETDHPLLLATQKARELLAGSTFERLSMVDELVKQRQLGVDTLFILQQMAQLSLQTTKPATAKRWQTILESSYEAAEALNNSGQPKLVFTKFMLY